MSQLILLLCGVHGTLLSLVLTQFVTYPRDLETIGYNEKYRLFLSDILKNYNIRQVILSYGLNEELCKPLDDLIFTEFLIPVMVRNHRGTSHFLQNGQNSQILSIECLADINNFNSDEHIQTIFEYFEKSPTTKIILYINENPYEENLTALTEIFEVFFNEKFLNVIAIFKQISNVDHNITIENLVYYSFKPFPYLNLERHTHPENVEEMFPNRVRNVEGHQLMTLPFQEIPRLVLAENKEGNVIMIGYLGRFITAFAEYINATLTFPYAITTKASVFYADLENMVSNNTIDIAASIVPVVNYEHQHSYTYPIEIIKYCLMIPVAEPVPIPHILFYLRNTNMLYFTLAFAIIFTCLLNVRKHEISLRSVKRRTWQNPKGRRTAARLYLDKIFESAEYIVNDVAICGVLGQPFVMARNPEFILKSLYILVSVTGLYLSFIYSAYLQTMLTLVPKLTQARTFDDLYSVNKPIFTNQKEWEYINYTSTTALPILLSYGAQPKFNALRNNFNTSYSYFVGRMVWDNYFEVRQSFFAKRKFIFSTDACIPNEFVTVIPMVENSIYMPSFNQFILTAYDFGFMQRWQQGSVTDMVKQNIISLKDPSPDDGGLLVDLYALRWVWLLYGIGMLLNLLVFLAEVFL